MAIISKMKCDRLVKRMLKFEASMYFGYPLFTEIIDRRKGCYNRLYRYYAGFKKIGFR